MTPYKLDELAAYKVRLSNGEYLTGYESFSAAMRDARAYKGVVIAPDGIEVDPFELEALPGVEAIAEAEAEAGVEAGGPAGDVDAPADTEPDELATLQAELDALEAAAEATQPTQKASNAKKS